MKPINDNPTLPEILAECDKCVMCGLCLPHCPTYTLSLDENESPRGRISLARALLRGEIHANPKTEKHLDHCLTCRACERMCPSGVKYGRIIDGIRQQQAPKELPLPVSNKQQLRGLNQKLWWYQKSGLQAVVRGLHLLGNSTLARKDKLLPVISRQQPWAEHYSAKGTKKGSVQLFTGCIGDSIDQHSLRAAVSVLTQLGYDVIVPAQQTCCGGLDQHRGKFEQAEALAKTNQAAFDDKLPVISLHSGCTTTLQQKLANPVLDVCDFIIKENLSVELKPLAKRVLIHTPCTKKNVLRNSENVPGVLATIPQIDILELPASLPCCGAAGSYMLDFPDKADALREPSLDAIRQARADILVSSNIGCAMHLQAGLREQGIKIELIHPVELIARQLL